jgi:glycogen phosphorylase
MVKEYNERLYEPAAKTLKALSANNYKAAIELAQWKQNTRADWGKIRIEKVDSVPADVGDLIVGDTLRVEVKVFLGPVDPSHVRVQAYIGHSENGSISDPFTIELQEIEKGEAPGQFTFKGNITATESGSYGFNVRVIPTHPYLSQEHELRLITWAR